jgi:hypothetical protein
MGCERMNCPLSCSGHGQCMTMSTMQNMWNFSHTETDVYQVWDADKTMGCSCDYGYTGGACELKMCPKGQDPLVNANATHTIEIQTSSIPSAGALTGYFNVYFLGQSFKMEADVTVFDADRCRLQFQSLQGVKSVVCSVGAQDYASGGATYTIAFTGWPVNPKENNIFTHNGQPTVEDFHCDPIHVVNALNNEVHCTVRDVAPAGWDTVLSYDYCSNRGLCDLDTGECSCYQNFHGGACQVYTPQEIYTDFVDVMTINATDKEFTSAALRIQDAMRGDSGDWSSIYVETNEDTIDPTNRTGAFNITSYGDVISYRGSWSLDGPRDGLTGVKIHTSGLSVKGGITINDEGLEIVNNGNAGDVTLSSGASVVGGLLVKEQLQVTGGITGTGGLTVEGGMVVPDCLTNTPVALASGNSWTACMNPLGMYVGAGGADIQLGGIVLYGGMDVTGGLMLNEWRTTGMVVETGGLDVMAGGMTVWEKGLVVDRASQFEDGLTVTGGMTMYSKAGMVVDADGVTVTGGALSGEQIFLRGGGFSSDGRVSVKSDGMLIYSQLALNDSGLRVNAAGKGMYVSGGVQVSRTTGAPTAGGLSVTLGGMSVPINGVTVADGLTIATGGMVIAGGEVTLASGLHVTGGIAHTGEAGIDDQHLDVTGGFTVINTGVNIAAGGLTITADGVSMTDTGADFTISSGGTRVMNGGITVSSNGGLTVSDGLIYRATEGMAIKGGVDVEAGGLVYRDSDLNQPLLSYGTLSVDAGGIQVQRDGLNVSGIMEVEDVGLSVNLARPTDPHADAYNPTSSTVRGGLVSAVVVNLAGGLTADGGISIGSVGLDISSATDHTGGWGKWHEIRAGGLTVTGGVEVEAWGLKVQGLHSTVFSTAKVHTGGVEVTAGGCTVAESGIVVTAGGVQVLDGGMRMEAMNPKILPAQLNYLEGGIDSEAKISISGGLKVAGNVANANIVREDGGVVTKGGMTVAGGGLSANSAEFTSIGWNEVHTGQHDLRYSQHIYINDGMKVHDIGLSITNNRGPDAFDMEHKSGIKYGLHLSDPDTWVGAANGLRIKAGGLAVNNHGVTVVDGGVHVASAGMNMAAGVLDIKTGGLVVADGDFENDGAAVNIFGGLFIQASGLGVTGGMSVNHGGLVLTTDGDLDNENTLNVGVGLDITGTIHAVGEVDVVAGGMQITGGVTCSASGGTSNGLNVTSATINSFKGGATIASGGLVVTDGGVTVTAGGLVVAGTGGGGDGKGLDLTVGDLVITGDLDIPHNSLTCTALSTPSDRRLKTGIEALGAQSSLRRVRALRGVYYFWDRTVEFAKNIADGAYSNEALGAVARRVGLFAQDVQAVLPEAVTGLYDGDYLGVRYMDVLPLLVEAVKGLQENIVALAANSKSRRRLNSQYSDSAHTHTVTDTKQNGSERAHLEASIAELRTLLESTEAETDRLASALKGSRQL